MNSPRSFALRTAALALALAGIAHAGPGLAFWQSRTNAPAAPSPASALVAHRRTCTGVTETSVVAMVPSWHNARGPLHAVQTGVRRTCTTCGTSTAMQSTWENRRGPLAPVALRTTHDCDASCVSPVRRT